MMANVAVTLAEDLEGTCVLVWVDQGIWSGTSWYGRPIGSGPSPKPWSIHDDWLES